MSTQPPEAACALNYSPKTEVRLRGIVAQIQYGTSAIPSGCPFRGPLATFANSPANRSGYASSCATRSSTHFSSVSENFDGVLDGRRASEHGLYNILVQELTCFGRRSLAFALEPL